MCSALHLRDVAKAPAAWRAWAMMAHAPSSPQQVLLLCCNTAVERHITFGCVPVYHTCLLPILATNSLHDGAQQHVYFT